MLQTQSSSSASSSVASRPGASTLRKVVISKPGAYDRLKIEEAKVPEPGPGEVLVEVRAIGVNYADCMVRMGLYQSAKEFIGWPITPGFEIAGVVRAVGRGGRGGRSKVGDRVFGVTLFGGYASQVIADQRYLFPIPEGMSFEQAAAFPAVFMTAYFALHELAHPRPGAKVLIHSASGGVGGALVQLAKRAGCEVTGVVGAGHKVECARGHGADHVIDKSSEPLWARAASIAPDGFDVVCDANGVETLGQSYAHLRPAGKLVIYGFHTMIPRKGGRPSWPKLAWDWARTPRYNPLVLTQDSKSVLAFNLSYLFDRLDLLEIGMRDLSAWLSEGAIRAPGVRTFALSEVAQAHQAIESGQTTGKLVLVP